MSAPANRAFHVKHPAPAIPTVSRETRERLDAYMALPPRSYDAIDPALIRPRPGAPPGHFTLAVPRAGILGVWVEPTVDVVVAAPAPGDPDPRVTITSVAARLKGSPSVEALRLADRFSLAFTAELTWQGAGGEGGGGAGPWLCASTRVTVWAEPLGPFALLPRGALVSAGDALLAGLSNALLPAFLRRLAADFEGWAGSAAVRAARSARAAVAGVGVEEEAEGEEEEEGRDEVVEGGEGGAGA